MSELASFRTARRRESPHYANGPGCCHRGTSVLYPVGSSRGVGGWGARLPRQVLLQQLLQTQPGPLLAPSPHPALSPQSPVLLPCSLRRALGEAEKKGCVLSGERRKRREEGLSSRKRSRGGSFWGSEAAERERKGEASNKPICQERPGPHGQHAPTLMGRALYPEG